MADAETTSPSTSAANEVKRERAANTKKARAAGRAAKAAADAKLAQSDAEAAERRLARSLAIGIPAVTVIGAAIMGTIASAGPAILVLAGGTLIGTIALFWASLRTLGGDAPLPEDLEAVAARATVVDELHQRKATVLRALKDLEHERAIGKIEDEDYAEISATYREQAKEILREIDADVAPFRDRAEQIAATYLKRRGLDVGRDATPRDDASDPEVAAVVASAATAPKRRACPACATSNEPDAAFCKKCGTRLHADGSDEAKDATDVADAEAQDAEA